MKIIALNTIQPSKTNPRKTFDKDALAELTESVKTHGVLQPVLVRPNGKGYELVAGERRFRAAKAAKLEEIPAVVRELDDKQVLEVQVIENLQREDLHPLEEAEGYRQLHEKHGYHVDELAEKVGKSKAYVYARMKLCSLPKKAKTAFLRGDMSASIALLVARVPNTKLAQEAAEAVLRKGWDGKPIGFREAKRIIHNNFMLALKDAPFSKTDADLLPKAGPCTKCPKRTGNQPLLFEDVRGADVCTDPVCYHEKEEAFAVRVVAEAKEKGQNVLDFKQAKKLFRHGRLDRNSRFVDLSARCDEDVKWRPWRAVIGKKHMPPVVIAVSEDSKVHELVDRTDAMKACQAKGYKWARPGKKKAADTRAAKKKFEERVAKEGTRRVIGAVIERLEKSKRSATSHKTVLRVIAVATVARAWNEIKKTVAKRRGVDDLAKWAKDPERTADELLALTAEFAVTQAALVSWGGGGKDLLDVVAKALRLDTAALKRGARSDLTPKKKAKKKKAPARKKTAKKKTRTKGRVKRG